MKFYLVISLFLIIGFTACEDEAINKTTSGLASQQQLIIDQGSFDHSWSSLQTENPVSDPFQLNGLRHDGTILILDVAYSGGCKEHTFKLIWPEVTTMIYPPRYSVILEHDAHEDLCEAYLTDTLQIDLSEYDLGLTPDIMEVIDLTIINGSNGEESLNLHN